MAETFFYSFIKLLIIMEVNTELMGGKRD